jgi:hypothetical protein
MNLKEKCPFETQSGFTQNDNNKNRVEKRTSAAAT